MAAVSFILEQPKSSVVGLLNEMIRKFEEDPPLSSKKDNKDPHELLAFVSNIQINDGTSLDISAMLLMINNWTAIVGLTGVCFRWKKTS